MRLVYYKGQLRNFGDDINTGHLARVGTRPVQ